MAHVFISYSREDKAYVSELTSSLTDRAIDVWMDDEIDYGDRYPRVIQKHLAGCAAVVLVMSENSEDSEWVANELAYAKAKKKPVLPLLLSGDLWLTLATTQHADVTDGSMPPQEFYARLLTLVAQGAPASTSLLDLESHRRPILRLGSKGEAVYDLQEQLAQLGIDSGQADGIYGGDTRTAVVAFQKGQRLPADGIVGPETWIALDRAEAAGIEPG